MQIDNDYELGGGRYKDDHNLHVTFYKHPQQNDAMTKEKGRPIFEDKDYISIRQPGNKDHIIVRPATDMDKSRFAEHYRKYTAREGDYESVEGTPLSEWSGVTRSQVEELKYLNVRTVEQLAGVADSNAQQFMGLQMLKQKAGAYLETAKDEAVSESLSEARRENEELKVLLSELGSKVEALESKKSSGRGKKVAED